MNFGQQTGAMVSTASIINSLDQATREKVLAELPDELKRRLAAEQHAAILAASGYNVHPNVAQQLLGSGFLNLSTPETVVGRTVNLLKTPVASLAHTMLKTSAAGASHNIGSNHGTPVVLRIPTGPPGAGINSTGSKGPAVNHSVVTTIHGAIGVNNPALRVSEGALSQSVNVRPLGPGITLNLEEKERGASTSLNFNPRVAMAHNTASMNGARQLGGASPAHMPMSLSAGNSIHLTSSQRSSSLVGSPPGFSGHLRQKPILSTYLDDFKQGFPSKGLSVISNRWWGSAEPDKMIDVLKDIDDSPVGCLGTDASVSVESNSVPSLKVAQRKDGEAKEILKSCMKVTRSRKLAAMSGRRALRLGVTKGYGLKKLDHKEAAILQFIFGDSLPRQWSAALPSSEN